LRQRHRNIKIGYPIH